jgi:hypothetical protein
MAADKQEQADKLNTFLDALTELSRKYKIGIAGQPVLFLMESEDLERAYSCDAESNLTF